MFGDTATRMAHVDWEALNEQFPDEILMIEGLLSEFEQEHRCQLLPPAVDLLMLPLAELLLADQRLDETQLRKSIATIFAAMDRASSSPERGGRDVLAAMAQSWCQIPPFC